MFGCIPESFLCYLYLIFDRKLIWRKRNRKLGKGQKEGRLWREFRGGGKWGVHWEKLWERRERVWLVHRTGEKRTMFERAESPRWGWQGPAMMPNEKTGCSCPLNIWNSKLTIVVVACLMLETIVTCKSQRLFPCLWFWGNLGRHQSSLLQTGAPWIEIRMIRLPLKPLMEVI